MKTVADPERQRSRLESTIRPAVRFSPLLKGDSVCGSKLQGIEKLFFQAEARFLLVFQKKWGCIIFPKK